jgi:glycosyltransferase involved in cell wall biosynthesis
MKNAQNRLMSPFFSITISVWNRRDEISRCLDSIFSQDFEDYEVIAVDDASDDDSVAVMRRYTDARLHIIEQPENRGMTAALQRATDEARGQWCLKLDSDWTLVPGALRRLAKMAEQAGPEIGVIGGCARTDKGEIWPVKQPPPGPFGLPGFLRWLDVFPSDFLACRRRAVFEKVKYPTVRASSWYVNLCVARDWRLWITSDILAVAYTDSPNRVRDGTSPDILAKKHQIILDRARLNEEILNSFGKEIKKASPHYYAQLLRFTSRQYFFAGQRVNGLRFGVKVLLRRPWWLKAWGGLILGVLGFTKIRFDITEKEDVGYAPKANPNGR